MSRERLLEAAGRGFRTGGYGGIGVDALAKEAGLTSGAFYSYFGSKADAFRLAVEDGFAFFHRGIAQLKEKHGDRWVPALVDFYFRERLQVDLCAACVLPSLTADVMRSGDETRFAYEKAAQELAAAIAAGLDGPEAERRAWMLLGIFAGGGSMARAVRDETVRAAIVSAMREAAMKIATDPSPAVG